MTIAQKTLLWLVQVLRSVRTQLLLSQTGGLSHCRYDESCGDYLGRQIKEKGARVGLWIGIKRIVSCQGLL